MRDRVQTIPFKIISKASWGPQYGGTLILHVQFPFSGALLLGGQGPVKFKRVQHELILERFLITVFKARPLIIKAQDPAPYEFDGSPRIAL